MGRCVAVTVPSIQIGGQRFRFARMRRNADGATAGDRFDALLPTPNTFGIARGGIENDNCISHTGKYRRALIFSSNSGCVTSQG